MAGTLYTFLQGYGLRQLVIDRRVWVYQSAAGGLVVHGHVNDSRFTSSSAVRSHFYRHWAAEFGEPLNSEGCKYSTASVVSRKELASPPAR